MDKYEPGSLKKPHAKKDMQMYIYIQHQHTAPICIALSFPNTLSQIVHTNDAQGLFLYNMDSVSWIICTIRFFKAICFIFHQRNKYGKLCVPL